MQLASGTRLGRYTVVTHIGSGGMGEVYRAHDEQLGRDVAIKILPSVAAGDLQRVRRFELEARAASALNHPNILAVYDVGTHDRAPYLVTELLEGQTLADHLTARRPPVDRALDLALQMALGLAAAHAKGIVHRDFKPDNVFVTADGRVKILDFGLAKQLLLPGHGAGQSQVATFQGATVTEAGLVLGTVGYMSPEQAKGMPADSRSDVFGFGCVMYEMLGGRRAFARRTPVETLSAILTEHPADLGTLAAVPPDVLAIVERCLEKSPDARFASAAEVVLALRSLSFRSTRESADAAAADKSLLVLPFTDLSPGKDNEYFSDGLTEEIIADLSCVASLRVISRTTAMSLKQTPKNVPTLARELSVGHVLEGSVRRAGNNLRITAQLVDASSDRQVWSERFSGTLDDVFDIQERVARSIAETLKVKLTASEDRRMARRPISSIQVYDCFLRARTTFQSFSPSRLQEAERLLREGLEVAGENALLLAGLARLHFEHVDMGMEGEESLADAETFARRALALDPDCGPACLVLGQVEHFRGNLREAVTLLRRSSECDPSDTDTLWWLAWFHLWLAGQPGEAMKFARRHVDLDPVSPMSQVSMAFVHLVEERFDEAWAIMQGLPLDNMAFLHSAAWTRAAMGRREEAIAMLAPLQPDGSFDPFRYSALFLRFALTGECNRFGELLHPHFVRLAELDACTAVCLTTYYAMGGDYETALDWLEKAVSRGYFNYPYLRAHHPLIAPLHGNPRFERLMEGMKAKWLAFQS